MLLEGARSLAGPWFSFALGLWLALEIPNGKATEAAAGARESRITMEWPGMLKSPLFLSCRSPEAVL